MAYLVLRKKAVLCGDRYILIDAANAPLNLTDSFIVIAQLAQRGRRLPREVAQTNKRICRCEVGLQNINLAAPFSFSLGQAASLLGDGIKLLGQG